MRRILLLAFLTCSLALAFGVEGTSGTDDAAASNMVIGDSAASTVVLEASSESVAPESAPLAAESSDAPAETTAAPAEATAAPAEATEMPAETAAAPAETTAAPAEATETPAETTAAPAEATETPAETTAAPAEATETPAETTAAPAEATAAPAETTAAPAEATAAPAETTAAPAEAVPAISASEAESLAEIARLSAKLEESNALIDGLKKEAEELQAKARLAEDKAKAAEAISEASDAQLKVAEAAAAKSDADASEAKAAAAKADASAAEAKANAAKADANAAEAEWYRKNAAELQAKILSLETGRDELYGKLSSFGSLRLEAASYPTVLRSGFDGSKPRLGTWKQSAGILSQTDARQYFSRLTFPLVQSSKPILYSFETKTGAKGWVGTGIHLFTEGVKKTKGYGEGKSLLVWLTRDLKLRGNDGTYLQVYRSNGDVSMERVLDAKIKERLDSWNRIEVLYEPSEEFLVIAVNGSVRAAYRTFFGIGTGATMSLRTLGGGVQFRNLEVRQ